MPFIFKVPPITFTYDEIQKLVSADGLQSDSFGFSVSISGNMIVVGAVGADPGGISSAGAAYVYEWDGSVWNQVQKLVASDVSNGSNFGRSISIDGNILVVGATGTNSNFGGAYIFEYNGVVWNEVQKIIASDGANLDLFGFSSSISGNTVVVGAYQSNPGGINDQGSVYVYEKSGTWPATETQKLLAGDGVANDSFGYSVSISGGTIAVGAHFADISGKNNQGVVYVFEKSGTWIETQKMTSSDGLAQERLGYSVSIDGTTIISGANLADIGGNIEQGAVYVFEKAGSWPVTETQKLIASDGSGSDNFGYAVSVSGTYLVIGSPFADISGNSNQGANYIFRYDAGSWVESQKLSVSDGATNDAVSKSVSMDGANFVTGANNATVSGNVGRGAAYVFKK